MARQRLGLGVDDSALFRSSVWLGLGLDWLMLGSGSTWIGSCLARLGSAQEAAQIGSAQLSLKGERLDSLGLVQLACLNSARLTQLRISSKNGSVRLKDSLRMALHAPEEEDWCTAEHTRSACKRRPTAIRKPEGRREAQRSDLSTRHGGRRRRCGRRIETRSREVSHKSALTVEAIQSLYTKL